MAPEVRMAIDDLASTFRRYIMGESDNSNLEQQLESNGIEIKYFDDEQYDAFLKWDRELKRPIISVNVTQQPTRQNFSIAHELGHLVLDWKWLPGNDLSDKDKDVLSIKYRGADNYTEKESKSETKVNEFAAAFLMPDYEIEELLKNSDYISMIEVIKKLARNFDVSEWAADIRLTNYLRLRNDIL